MKRVAEIAVFVALAVGIHIAFAMRLSSQDGAEAAGQSGEAMVSLAASSQQIAAMVEDWDRPPEAEIEPQQIETAAPPPPPVQRPTTEAPPPRAMAMMNLPQSRADMPALPTLDAADPPPPPEEEIEEIAEPEEEEEVVEEEETQPDQSAMPVAQSLRPMERPERIEREQRERRQVAAQEAESQGRSNQNSTARAAQRAAGSGGSTQAGQSGGRASTLSQGEASRLSAVWGAQIRSRIEAQKRHPGGRTGNLRVVVRLSVTPTGQVTGAGIARSSGRAQLDQAALTAVSRAGRMPIAPAGLTDASYTFNLPMDFR